MKNSDVELVNRILDGDESAFSELVKKYQKSVHALVWRKIGDFHIAEEITQDTFLTAYRKLATLKKPQRFTSWLYVIAANNCKVWLRKKRLQVQSLEETESDQLEKATYSQYLIEENERTTGEAKREVVKKLLAKLQESDRTVITLHYFGEMSAAEIGAFLGVSVNTIKSRLRRAQQRLKREEPMIREAVGNFQITPHLTENIMREISRMTTPAAPSGGKPILPWAVSAATALLIFLIIGVGSQYLARFQKPYNIDVQSETTVELIDTRTVLDTPAKPDLRNQAGRFDNPSESSGAGPQLSEPVTLGAALVEKEPRPSTAQQWVQASGPEGATVSGLLLSATGDVYASSPIGIYRLTPNTSAWTLTNVSVVAKGPMPMAERGRTLYLVSAREVYASTDNGEHWESLGARPKGEVIGLVITDDGLYLALDKQIFRSIDVGKQWTVLGTEETDRINLAIAAIENTVFIGTNRGLYRIHAGTSEKLPVDTTKAIQSLAVSGRNLYVGTGPGLSKLTDPEGRATPTQELTADDNSSSWKIFHSTDLGDSWTEITPISDSPFMKVSPSIKVLAAGETLLALGFMTNFRSTDAGKTWTDLGFEFDLETEIFDMNALMNSVMMNVFPAVTVDEKTFIKASLLGLTRSTDGGISWHPFMNGIVGTQIFNLVGFKNALYTSTVTGVLKSIDGGESWEPLRLDTSELTEQRTEKNTPSNLLMFARLLVSNGVLYSITTDLAKTNGLHVLRLSASDNVLVPIQGFPTFAEDIATETQETELRIPPQQDITDDSANYQAKIENQTDAENGLDQFSHGFAVSGETFYVAYKQRLFRWQRGDPEWTDTGLINITQPFDTPFNIGLKIAVSADTVYVGKQDKHLLRSLDGGNTWKDLTPNLPLRFKRISDIAFADSIVYVATDTGILTSEDGEHWRVITDKEGTHTVIDRIAVTDTTIYGVGDAGVYQLEGRGRWERISPEVPDDVTALVVNDNKLYIATEERGIFHIPLETEN